MIVYRLSREKYKDRLSGYGASLYGQRWNSKGIEVIYTAQSRALANSEVAVHISLGILPKDYHMVEIDIPNSIGICEPCTVISIAQAVKPFSACNTRT